MYPVKIRTFWSLLAVYRKFWPDFNQIWSYCTDFHKCPKHRSWHKSVHWEPRWYVRTDRHMNIMRQTGAFCNANAPIKYWTGGKPKWTMWSKAALVTVPRYKRAD